MAKMSHVVVAASNAKCGKALLGGFQVNYTCPQCKEPLASKNDAITVGDTCPECKTSFVFDEDIKQAFADFRNEKTEQENTRVTAQAEQKRIRQIKQEERARLAAEQEAKLREEYEKDRARANEFGRLLAEGQEKSRRDVSGPYFTLIVFLIVSWMGSALAVILGLAIENMPLGVGIVSLGIVTAASTVVVWLLFRFLVAIHALLSDIVQELRSLAK